MVDQLGGRMSARSHRLAFALTALMIAVVLVGLPFVLASMREQLFSRQQRETYDLDTGRPVKPEDAAEAAAKGNSFFTLAIKGLDIENGTVTVGVAGNRVCPGVCPASELRLYSLTTDPELRRGLPPSDAINLAEGETIVDGDLELPVDLRPTLYPFDDWTLILAAVATNTLPDGRTVIMTPENTSGNAVVSMVNQNPDFLMKPPQLIDPKRVASASDTFSYPVAVELSFYRPRYLRFLAVALILLIAVSAVLALTTRSIGDLLLGIGGLILGVWGIRSVIVPSPLPVITAVDLSLSLVIVVLLLGLAVRAARHFWGHTGWSLPGRG